MPRVTGVLGRAWPAVDAEPGVVPTLRLFAGAMALLQCGRALAMRWRGAGDPFVAVTGLVMAAVFVAVSWPWLARRLGPALLPGALAAAALAPILGGAADRGAGLTERLYFWLVPPLILIGAQYGMRAVVAFALGTSLLPLLLLARSGDVEAIRLAALGGGARLFLFTLAGFFIVRLSAAQRAQRAELAERNRQLATFAALQEQLAVSRERNRLARELHDTLAHTLSALGVQLNALEVQLARDPDAARAALPQLQALARGGLHESRRALQALRADPVEALGLLGALRRAAEQAAAGQQVELAFDMPERLPPLPPDVEHQLFRIAEEALNNVVKHAGARRISVAVRADGGALRLAVADDGRGFDVAGAAAGGRLGLRGLRERAALIGAELSVVSQPGRGATVAVALPLARLARGGAA